MRALLIASVVVGLVIAVTNEAAAGEKEDILLAERAIAEIKAQKKANKRAYDRAFRAITGTSEGKKRLRGCSRKDASYWPTCIAGKWDYEPAYKFLYNKFYKEELKKLRGP